MKSIIAACLLAVPLGAAEITVEVKPEAVIFRNGAEVITEYRYAGQVKAEKGEGTKPLAKPYFYPLHAPGGAEVTRAWPMIRGTSGETTDHFWQKSAWFCHGDVMADGLDLKTRTKDKHVTGADFWSEVPGHGRIICTKVEKTDDGILTENEWRTADEIPLLAETRRLRVIAVEAGYLIFLETELKAKDFVITFGDTKEGSLGVRVPDGFNLKATKSPGAITSSDGSTAKAPAKDDLPMWGKVAEWNDYSGDSAGIAIFADPKNGLPSAWHTRAYGLMAANPFGRGGSGFPALKGRTDLVKLAKGESLKLKFGIYAHTGNAKDGKVAAAYEAFKK